MLTDVEIPGRCEQWKDEGRVRGEPQFGLVREDEISRKSHHRTRIAITFPRDTRKAALPAVDIGWAA